ncbi:MAG: ArsR/SmtB family transcription factor [Treponemataceae bacterium]
MDKKNNLSEQDFEKLEQIYKLFGSIPRLKILLRLNDGECDAGELSLVAGLSQSATSHQLKDLRQGKIIKAKKKGLHMEYSLDDHHIFEIIKSGINHVKGENCYE